MTATTISVEGDKAFTKKMKKLAVLRDSTVAQLVRDALDRAYGDEIERVSSSSFFAPDDAYTHHNSCNGAVNDGES